MAHATTDSHPARRRLSGSWGLFALAGGALALVVIALIAIAMADRRQPELAPDSTPEGVVQRFFAATYRGDYAAAYGMLSDTAQHERSLAEFQERMRYERQSEMRVDAAAVHGETASVIVTVSHFSAGDIFGGGEWSAQYDLLLERDGDSWRITGEPFW